MRWLALFLLLSTAFAAGIYPFDIRLNNASIIRQGREISVGDHNTVEIVVERAPLLVKWYRIRILPEKYSELANIFGIPLEGEPNIWVNSTTLIKQEINLPKSFCGKVTVQVDVKIYEPRLNHTTQYGISRDFVKECKGLGDRIISAIIKIVPLGLIARFLGI